MHVCVYLDHRKLRVQLHSIRIQTAPKDSLCIAGIVLDMCRGKCAGEVIECGEDHFGERAAAAARSPVRLIRRSGNKGR